MVHQVQLKRLAQSTWAGAEHLITDPGASSCPDQVESISWFHSPDQDDAIKCQDVEHPVDAIVEINVGGSGRVLLKELPSGRTKRRMTRFVTFDRIRLCLHNPASDAIPYKSSANEFPGHRQMVSSKKGWPDGLSRAWFSKHHGSAVSSTQRYRLTVGSSHPFR